MRILHYVNEANLAWGRPWVQLLLSLEEMGLRNVVLCPPGGTLARLLEEYSVPHIYSGALVPWFPPFCKGVGNAIEKIRPDVLHTRLSSAAFIGGYWGSRLGIPVVSTIDKYPRKKYYYMNSGVIVGCSAAVSAHMEKIGFPADRIVTIRNPVDSDSYQRSSEERSRIRNTAGVSEDDVVFLGLGRFVDWKAFDILIQACARIPKTAKWRLWLVGDGPEHKKLKRLVDEYALEDRTLFWGYVSDVRPFLWGADFFVQPSNKPEGFSLALLEAMAAGLPAAATKIGGTLDILDGGGVFPCEPDDVEELRAILETFLSLSKEERDALGRDSLKSSSRFSVQVIAKQYSELYRACFALPPI